MPRKDGKDKRRGRWRLYPKRRPVSDETRERLQLAADTGIPAALNLYTGRALARRGLVDEVSHGEFMPRPGAMVDLAQPFLRGARYAGWLREKYPAEHKAADERRARWEAARATWKTKEKR